MKNDWSFIQQIIEKANPHLVDRRFHSQRWSVVDNQGEHGRLIDVIYEAELEGQERITQLRMIDVRMMKDWFTWPDPGLIDTMALQLHEMEAGRVARTTDAQMRQPRITRRGRHMISFTVLEMLAEARNGLGSDFGVPCSPCLVCRREAPGDWKTITGVTAFKCPLKGFCCKKTMTIDKGNW